MQYLKAFCLLYEYTIEQTNTDKQLNSLKRYNLLFSLYIDKQTAITFKNWQI